MEDCFDRAWKAIAARGRCDEYGGAEYHRCLRLWHSFVGRIYATDFILHEANRPAPPAPEVRTEGGGQ